MKKILSVILIMLSVMTITASSEMLSLSEGNIDGVRLYSSDGSELDALSPVGRNGMVIQTDGDGKLFTSSFGDIYLEGDSLLAVTGYEDVAPSLYLVYGNMSIMLTSDIELSIFTPAISVLLPGQGEYVFSSTDESESFMNFSDSTVTVHDGLRGVDEDVPSMQSIDLLAWPREAEAVTAAEYYANSASGSKVIYDAPAIPSEPTMTEPSASIVSEEAEQAEPVAETEETVPSVPSMPVVLEPSIAIDETAELPEEPVIIVPEEPVITETPEVSEEPETVAEPEVVEAVEEEVVESEIVEEEPVITTPSITEEPAAIAEDHLPFDIRLQGRAYVDQNNHSAIGASIQPYFSTGAFTIGFNIDPFIIYDVAVNSDTYSISDWIRFGSSFIDSIIYENDVVSIRADRASLLDGDKAGLSGTLRHEWDNYTALSFNHEVNTEYYSHRLWFDDLSFTRMKDEAGNALAAGGLELSFSAGDAYPITLTIGAVAEVYPDAIKSSMLYPEASLYIPFIYSDDVSFGLRAGAAISMKAEDLTFSPFERDGLLATALLPFSAYGFYGEVGAAYSTGEMHYGMVGNNAYNPEPGEFISAVAKLGYSNEFFGIEGFGLIDVDFNEKAINKANSYVEANAYVNLFGVKLLGGFRSAFADFNTEYEYYAGLGADLGPMESRMLLGYNNENKFSLSFVGSISTFGKDKEKSYYESDFPISGSLELGYRYDIFNGSNLMLVTPRVEFGNDEYAIALRAPFEMDLETGAFRLAGFNGHELWDFGTGEYKSTDEQIYRIITDSFALVDRIKLGDEEDTLAYILADRNYIKKGTLFTGFGSEDSLSVRLGFNFPNLSMGVYVDNAEAPHIVEGSLAFYPADNEGFALRLNVPGEILISSLKDYALLFYPEIRLDFPFAEKSYMFSIYALGKISTVYEGGVMKMANVLYDFRNERMDDWMAGAAFSLNIDEFGFTAEGGVRSGRIAPEMFNEFTLLRHDTAGTLTEILDAAYPMDMKWYGKLAFSVDYDFFDFRIAYTVSDFLALATADSADLLSVAISGNVSENAKLYAAFTKDNFASSLLSKTDFLGYFRNDTIFRLGADFSFGHAGFTAELATSFLPSENSTYVNVLDMNKEASVSLTIKSRLSF